MEILPLREVMLTTRPLSPTSAGSRHWVTATWPKDVHLEDAPPLVERHHFDRACAGDSGIVDQRPQRPRVPLDAVSERRAVVGNGDVEDHRLDSFSP